jgi:hypothetical protein
MNFDTCIHVRIHVHAIHGIEEYDISLNSRPWSWNERERDRGRKREIYIVYII